MSDATSTATEQVQSLISTGLIVVTVIFPILSLIAACLRYKVRRRPGPRLLADDWWLAIAWLSAFAMSITVWTFAGLSGVNFYTVDLATATKDANLCLWIASWFNQIALTTVKIALLLFYKRIFSVKSFHIVVWVTIAAVSCWGIIFFWLTICWGKPISKAYTGVGIWLYDVTATSLANVGCSICLDILVLCLPLFVISRLRLPTKEKIGIGLIFWLGIFCCVCSIVRLVLLHKVLYQVVDSASNIGVQSTQSCFLIIEPHCSIIAASLPCYGPLLAGKRGPESMIRSIRSIFSLQSMDATHADSRAQKPEEDATGDKMHYGSHVNLEQQNGTQIAYQKDHGDISQNSNDAKKHNQDSITVTKGVYVNDSAEVV